MIRLLTCFCLFFLHSSVSHAALTMNFAEVGPDVVATVSGSIGSLAASTGTDNTDRDGSFAVGTSVAPDWICVLTVGGSTTPIPTDFYFFNDWSNASTCNTGAAHFATASTGDYVGIFSRITSGIDAIEVPAGYVSGAPLSGTSTWAGQTLASMGLVAGTYVYTWGGIEFPVDTLTVIIDSVTYTVGGDVSGLTGAGLELENSGSDTLPIVVDGAFMFVTELADTVSYVVAVSAQPTGQTCSVISGGSNNDGSGTIAAADVTDIVVTCVDDAPTQPVPTLPQWTVILLSLLMMGYGLYGFRRRY